MLQKCTLHSPHMLLDRYSDELYVTLLQEQHRHGSGAKASLTEDAVEAMVCRWEAREEWLLLRLMPHPSVLDALVHSLPHGASPSGSMELQCLFRRAAESVLREMPRRVVGDLVMCIRSGSILSVGELAYCLCLAETPATMSNTAMLWLQADVFGHRKQLAKKKITLPGLEGITWTREDIRCAASLQVSPLLLHFIQESYLRALPKRTNTNTSTTTASAREGEDEGGKQSPRSRDPAGCGGDSVGESGTTWPDTSYIMFYQLLWMNKGLNQVRKEANIPVDPQDAEHLNRLQQLWASTSAALEAAMVAEDEEVAEATVTTESSTTTTTRREALGPFQLHHTGWRLLGFQSDDPASDFRGGGLLALQLLIHFARSHPMEWGMMLRKNRKYISSAASSAAAMSAGTASFYFPAVMSIKITTWVVAVLRQNSVPNSSSSKPKKEDATEGVPAPGAAFLTNPERPAIPLRIFHLVYDGLWLDTMYSSEDKSGNNDNNNNEEEGSSGEGASNRRGRGNEEELQDKDNDRKNNANEVEELMKAWWERSVPYPGEPAKGYDKLQRLQEAGREGLVRLHHALFIHFHLCWSRDAPSCLELNQQYMERVVLPSFFASEGAVGAALVTKP